MKAAMKICPTAEQKIAASAPACPPWGRFYPWESRRGIPAGLLPACIILGLGRAIILHALASAHRG